MSIATSAPRTSRRDSGCDRCVENGDRRPLWHRSLGFARTAANRRRAGAGAPGMHSTGFTCYRRRRSDSEGPRRAARGLPPSPSCLTFSRGSPWPPALFPRALCKASSASSCYGVPWKTLRPPARGARRPRTADDVLQRNALEAHDPVPGARAHQVDDRRASSRCTLASKPTRALRGYEFHDVPPLS